MKDSRIAGILANPHIDISLAARILGHSNRISITRVKNILTDSVMPIDRAGQIIANENIPEVMRVKLV